LGVVLQVLVGSGVDVSVGTTDKLHRPRARAQRKAGQTGKRGHGY